MTPAQQPETADNGSRSTDDPRERQHQEAGAGSRYWWRCVPLATARQWEAAARSAALAPVLEALRKKVAGLPGSWRPGPLAEGRGWVATVDRAAVLSLLAAAPPLRQPEGLPARDDLADTLCYLRRHDDHPEERHCAPSWNEADRIVRCLSALSDSRRNRLAATFIVPTDGRVTIRHGSVFDSEGNQLATLEPNSSKIDAKHLAWAIDEVAPDVDDNNATAVTSADAPRIAAVYNSTIVRKK